MLAVLTILMHYVDGEAAVSRVLSPAEGAERATYDERGERSFALLSDALAAQLEDPGH